ncbi:MAG: hypothetical protein LBQ15_09480 [Clostridium sp.]|nr:hypothetical protein [Clostridium sp.]
MILGAFGVAALVLTAAAALWLKGYYGDRYALEAAYYTVVPLAYDNTPVYALDSNGQAQGLKAEYRLMCYNAEGEARELEFDAYLDFHDVYPPGTYLKVSVSKLWTIGKEALDVSEVPAKALEKIKENFEPSSASTLDEYAGERTRQLSARNTPSLTISCDAEETGLVYTYVYSANAKTLAEEAAEFLDPVYRSQFRTDQEAFPELPAIFLEIKLEGGTTIFSQKYDRRVEFGYELKEKSKESPSQIN